MSAMRSFPLFAYTIVVHDPHPTHKIYSTATDTNATVYQIVYIKCKLSSYTPRFQPEITPPTIKNIVYILRYVDMRVFHYDCIIFIIQNIYVGIRRK